MRGFLALVLGLALFSASCGGTPSTDRAAKSGEEAGTTAPRSRPADTPFKIGVTLHPYYSWVKYVCGELPIDVIAVLPGEVDAGSYQPAPEDIGKLADLDAIVVNGIGHDDFIEEMIQASGNSRIVHLRPNEVTPLLRSLHGEGPNSHTFISFSNAILQTQYIADTLAGLRPDYAEAFRKNAGAYTERLRAIQSAAAAKLAGAKIRRVVTVHDGYSYLLKEFGIELAGVVEPAHGLVPSAKELGEMIEIIKKEQIRVVLSEESFPDRLLQTLRENTDARVYIISHIATGAYSAEEFETGMAANADVLVKALVTDPS